MRHFLILLAILAATRIAPVALADDNAPATAPANRQAKNLQQIIADIRSAPDVNSAAADYAEGRNITRTNPALYNVYMVRMLQLNQPRIAMYPAVELTRLRDDNGLAWATVAYNRATEGRTLEALQAVVPAMKHRPDDPSTQHNAANLIAWYQQSDPRPQVSPEIVRIIDQSLPAWKKLPQFALTSEEVAKAYTGKARQAQQIEQQSSDAQRTARSLENEAQAIDDAYRRNDARIQDIWNAVRRLRWNLSDNELALRRTTDPNELRRLHAWSRSIRRDLSAALREIQDRQDENDDLAARARQLRDQRQAVAADIRKIQDDLDALGPTTAAFTWHPPTVAKLGEQPGPNAQPPQQPAADARPAEHERQLRMALLLLDNGFQDKAVETLREIVKRFPASRSATQAQAILKQLELPPLQQP